MLNNTKLNIYLVLLYTVLLSMACYSWWPSNFYLLGGDDIKYEYIDPISRVNGILNLDFLSKIGSESSLLTDISGAPFYIFLAVIKLCLPFINLQKLIYSIVLGGGFLGFYWMTNIFVYSKAKKDNITLVIQFVSANVYAFSTYNIVTLWDHQLPIFVDIALIPIIFGLFVRSTINFSIKDCILAGILISISPLPYGSIPWTLPVVFCGAPLFLTLTVNHFKSASCTLLLTLASSVIFLMPTIITSLDIKPFTTSMFNDYQMAASVRIFKAVNEGNSLIDLIAMLPPQEFLKIKIYPLKEWAIGFQIQTYLILIIVLSLTISAILNFKNKNNYVLIGILLSWFLCLFLFAGVGNFSLNLITNIVEHLPFLIMFRNSYDKFSMAISLYSSLSILCLLMSLHQSTIKMQLNDEII